VAPSWSTRINLDGVIGYAQSGPPSNLVYSYIQLHRNGIIEVVNGTLLAHTYKGRPTIPSISYEHRPFEYLPKCFELLRRVGVAPPVVVAITLTNVRGLGMGIDQWSVEDSSSYPIAHDTLIPPEAWVEDMDQTPGKALKPMFDLVWNACGHASSRKFDDEGNWIARQ
jgi:hypothetical protein